MQNKIVYTLILRKNKTVLSEYTQFTGNFQQVVLKLFSKMSNEGDVNVTSELQPLSYEHRTCKFSLRLDKTKIFCVSFNGISFVCLVECDQTTSLIDEVYYSFLFKLKIELLKCYTWEKLFSCYAYSLIEFVRVISVNVISFNSMRYNEPIRPEISTIPNVDVNHFSYGETRISLISIQSSRRKSTTGEPSFQSSTRMFNNVLDSKRQTLIGTGDFPSEMRPKTRRCLVKTKFIVLLVCLVLIAAVLAIYFLFLR